MGGHMVLPLLRERRENLVLKPTPRDLDAVAKLRDELLDGDAQLSDRWRVQECQRGLEVAPHLLLVTGEHDCYAFNVFQRASARNIHRVLDEVEPSLLGTKEGHLFGRTLA